MAPLGLRLVKHLRDGRARQDVVELLKQQRPPIRRRCLRRQQGTTQLRLAQQPLQAALVPLLIGAAGGAAAVQLQIELIAPDRQLLGQRFQGGQIGPQGAVPLGGRHGLPLPEGQLLEHFGGGSAAMVPHPRQPERIGHAAHPLPSEAIPLDRQGIPIGADTGRDQGQHLGSTATAPTKQPMRERVGGIPGQLVGAEPAHAGGGGHGRESGGKPEAVRQPNQGMAPFREALLAVVLTLLELAQQRRRADQHAIGFHPGSIQRLPAAGPHGDTDPGE